MAWCTLGVLIVVVQNNSATIWKVTVLCSIVVRIVSPTKELVFSVLLATENLMLIAILATNICRQHSTIIAITISL